MKKLWLDLELREDIDDYITLVYALEQKKNVTQISIHNPSVNELLLLNKTIEMFKQSIPVIMSGEVTAHKKDIHPTLFDLIKGETNLTCIPLAKYLSENKIEDTIVFCGGSLYTLSKVLELNKDIEACVQGGYAAESVVGAKNVIDKFKGRDMVPTWNLNLDLNASDAVLRSDIKKSFVSKNICHNSWIGLTDLNNEKSMLNTVLKKYLNHNKRDKCMHDLLAFITMFDNDIVKFKNVDLFRTTDTRAKWYSVINKKSPNKISYELDLQKFKELFKSYKV